MMASNTGSSRRATTTSSSRSSAIPSGTRSSVMSSSIRSGAVARAGVRQTTRVSTFRGHNASASISSARAGAVSPAGSVSSVATSATAGTKRKERDFEADAGEETNINVVVRCRGRNEREVRENSAVVVSTEGGRGKLVQLSMGPNALSNKTYNFDQVFSPAADQAMIFEDVVKPIMEEMLSGYNCTIFAYGQTGTGKTYTMTGDMAESHGLLSDAAGIIPRVLQTLFNKLDADEVENCVRCSFIELYNEELRDLLSGDDSAKLKIFDDNSRKGHSTTVVQGMEERHIMTAADGIKRLQEGSVRRQVAATKCNDLSSRSHTVFTITVHTKRTTEDGEDYLVSGKLNLVDLAGSENIQRSGAENKRAAEAGLINKSLLTLGRVINALVDKSPHVPYRESKLTRLLQDSLGGRTKTCIIATVSPAKSNLEETISTLDYAFRAKNIRNKPQINSSINKKTLLREFSAEIEKLKSELIATRQRNGVYLSNEAYEEMTVQSESRRILSEEQAAKIETMENNLRHKVQELFDLTSSFMGLKKEHEGTKMQLDDTKEVLDQTELVLAATRKTLAEETLVRKAHQATEQKLQVLGGELITTLKRTVDDVSGLRAKNKRKSDLQSINRGTWGETQAQVADVTELVEDRIADFRKSQEDHISSISERMQSFVAEELEKLSSTQTFLDENLSSFDAAKVELLGQQDKTKEEMDAVLEEIKAVRDNIKERVGESLQAIASAAEKIAADVLSELGVFHNHLHTSYSSLGKDFKGIFEDLVKHITSQKLESDNLRRQIEAASKDAVESNEAVSSQLQKVVEDERREAAEERQQLLAQISNMISAQADAQEKRLASKAQLIRGQIDDSNETLQQTIETYSTGMDTWGEKEEKLAKDVHVSRDAIKSKLKDDWTTANTHSSSIQTTTKSVHAETVRVVDDQMADLTTQMHHFDDFLTRARNTNSTLHTRNANGIDGLSTTVGTSFNNISSHFTNAYTRVKDLGDEMDTAVDTIRENLTPLDETLCQPLHELRDIVAQTQLQEYQPTGATPEKTHYTYPTDLPATASHDALVAGMAAAPTPSKPAAAPVVFRDIDTSSTASPSDTLSSLVGLGQGARHPLAASLREVSANLTTGSILPFDPSASVMSMRDGVEEKDNVTVPATLFRKSARGKGAVKGRSVTGPLGLENVPPAAGAFAASVGGKRKSPRLN